MPKSPYELFDEILNDCQHLPLKIRKYQNLINKINKKINRLLKNENNIYIAEKKYLLLAKRKKYFIKKQYRIVQEKIEKIPKREVKEKNNLLYFNTNIPQSDVNDKMICYCKKHTYGILVLCSQSQCAIKYFHLDCLAPSLSKLPKSGYYCKNCSEKLL